MAKRGRGDPLAKRRDETDLQWRSRLARQREQAANGDTRPTPETIAQGGLQESTVWHEGNSGAKTFVRKSRSALAYMRDQGSITDDQFYSAQQIAQIAESIEKQVALGCASMEARVDCSRSAKDALTESLYRVRAEAAYTEWRSKLPLPRRMVIDMVTKDAGLSAIAAEHNMGWRKARAILTEALDRWPEIYGRVVKAIDQEDLDAQHARLRA